MRKAANKNQENKDKDIAEKTSNEKTRNGIKGHTRYQKKGNNKINHRGGLIGFFYS